jgi:hypothetical protein
MSDIAGGIKPLGPTYPITPAQRSNKDRETGKRREQREPPRSEKPEDDDQQPHIDELV